MTTTVTVRTAEHRAFVLAFPLKDGEPVGGEVYTQLGVVEPFTECEFTAFGSQDILVREEWLPEAAHGEAASAAAQQDEAA